MEQQGFADRDQYNFGGNYINVSGIGSLQSEGDDGIDSKPPGRAIYGFFTVAVVFTMNFFGIHSKIFSTSAPVSFPNTNGPWPTHSNSNLVMIPVENWLASCVDEPLLSPEYCPQLLSPSADDVSDVHWVIHGNPSYGARISYYNGHFYVLGHAVMTVTYNSSDGTQQQMEIVGYEATVAWKGRHATLASMKAVSPKGGPAVSKHNPNLSWPQISNAVEVAFRQCAAYDVAPMPTQCPDIGNDGSSVRWRLMNNPLMNARESFDPSTGLVLVTGSFVRSESYSEMFFGHQAYTWYGYYNASLSLDGTTIVVLQIEKQ